MILNGPLNFSLTNKHASPSEQSPADNVSVSTLEGIGADDAAAVTPALPTLGIVSSVLWTPGTFLLLNMLFRRYLMPGF